ncbi:MAG TPA: MBL fold metallo-hydrolase, partial [Kofleriaceae bacterium]|nr:MBL fold metallo-hydrolase [Kofleriaceae bacterium]
PHTKTSAPALHRAKIELTYLGVAGWIITDGTTTILIDPYASRQAVPPDGKAPHVDEAAVAKLAPPHADLILVGHSHFDHMLDVPAFAKRTGAQVMGSETTIAYARASGLAEDHLIQIKGGEDYEFERFSIRVIPSLHSAVGAKHPFSTPAGFGEGGTFAYLIRMSGHEILVFDTASFVERELEGLRPDVAIVATGARHEIHDYACRLMRATGAPARVLATHFDAWTKPLDEDRAPDDDTKQDLRDFEQEIHACAPSTRVETPAHLQPITIE